MTDRFRTVSAYCSGVSPLSSTARVASHAALPDAVFELLDAADSTTREAKAPTVTEAAAALGVDQPRASRLAGQAIEAGLMRLEADQHDGRRSLLVLTPEGHAVLTRIRDFRRRIFAEATAEWPAEDRAAFARLLTRFVRDVDSLGARVAE
ncbi:MarR family winged helix-turn-helix transcriptional regulator [Streptomyces sp. CA-250714]|uniref:MarR family winged helix-turn-helix transcriptional regulator n=1 Tax=Streptomyces sp. CA-250714 TaxID=3240060 RepID=UPI003D8F8FCB